MKYSLDQTDFGGDMTRQLVYNFDDPLATYVPT